MALIDIMHTFGLEDLTPGRLEDIASVQALHGRQAPLGQVARPAIAARRARVQHGAKGKGARVDSPRDGGVVIVASIIIIIAAAGRAMKRLD